MINHHYDKITGIVCDFCMDEEFEPVLEEEFEDSLYMAWEQATTLGWKTRWLDHFDEWGHCCPKCAKGFRYEAKAPHPQAPEAPANNNEGPDEAA